MKSLIKLILLFVSFLSFAQENEIDRIKEDYKKVRGIYENYRDEADLPNKYFHYYLKNKKEDYFIYLNKKKYDSLILLKLPDSIIINNSIYKIKENDSEYFFYSYRDPMEYYFVRYQNNKIIENSYSNIYGDYFRKEDYNNLTLQEFSFKKNASMVLYKYQQFSNIPFDIFRNITYEKTVFQDDNVRIYDYKKDFPISDEEFLKKVPNIFAEQSTELLKDGKMVKNFNKNTAKNISLHMLGAIIKAGDDYKYNYKYEFQKGYSVDDPLKPVYSFKFFMPGQESWTLGIDPKTEKITYISYGKGFIY